ncbi:hypothetical protein L195_g047051 [Trifolium pratense]|uniref:DDE Tnp4 domain-containing protein n=1 Tax=Trifolium pratense TaxID=57577 RepID=A0A2K3MJF6_TRIPR|nr:hypothetical protein L195_g047051 [Trifolium pratense]
MKVSREYLKFHDYTLEGPEANKWKWFENSIGALDGTHIPVMVAAEDRPRYRNRKGDITTNVLGVCGSNLRFIYALPGWEGSAGDSRVLRDALRRQYRLQIPNGKYFLVDAGYTNGPGFLAPYRGTRYHLKEWIGNTPQNYKELFNLRHSRARNVIERAFGVLKKRWNEKQSDEILEAQDLELLSAVDEELTNQQSQRVPTNGVDEISTVQVTMRS